MTRCSPNAARALAEARQARASNEALLPVVEELSLAVRDEVETNHFLEMIESITRARAAS